RRRVGGLSNSEFVAPTRPRADARVHPPPSGDKILHTFPSAASTTPGVIGIRVIAGAPSGRSASLTAFITAPGAPAVPASPAPFAPSSLSAVGETTWLT